MVYRISTYRSVLLGILLSFSAQAQLFQARLTSYGYAWQRSDTVGQANLHLFGYQSIQATVAQGDVSVAGYWQGFNDFSGPLKNKPEYRLYKLSARVNNVVQNVDLNVGRQTVFSGIGTGTFDGIWSGVRLADGLVNVNGYYGFLPAPRYKAELIGDKENNLMAGAQVSFNPLETLRASVSFSERKIQSQSYAAIRRDSLFNPYVVEIRPAASEEQLIGTDIDYTIGTMGSVYGRFDYDILFEKVSRLELYGRVSATDDLAFTGLYLTREPRISFNSIFSVFAYNTISEYEGGAEYSLDKSTFLFARVGAVSYGDDNAVRVSAGFNTKLLSASIAHNVGPESRLSSVSATAAYPMMDGTLTPTLNAGYAMYKLTEGASLTGAASIGLGAVYRPTQTISVDGQLMVLTNAWYTNDVRFGLRATYVISERLGIF